MLHRLVARVPLVSVGSCVGEIVWRSITQRVETKLLYELEVFLPPRVVSALRHLVDAGASRQCRVTVLDPRGEEKRSVHLGLDDRSALRKRTACRAASD